MRAQTGMRQLVWYKALFVASRIRYLAVIVSKGRIAREQSRGLHTKRKPSVRTSLERAEACEKSKETVREEVKMYCNMLKKTKALQSIQSKPEQTEEILPASPTSPREQSSSEDQSKSRMLRAKTPRSLKFSSNDNSKLSHSGASDEHRKLERWLATQGFILNPSAATLIVHEGSGMPSSPRARQVVLAPGVRQRAFINDISQTLGRQLRLHTPPALDDSKLPESRDEELRRIHTKAHSEVSEQVHIVTVRPDELFKMKDTCRGRTEQIGSNRFKQFYQGTRQRAADSIIKKEVRHDKVETSTGVVRVKFAKRYLLQFFESERADLQWLSLMQTLMLVIQGTSQFHSALEASTFHAKLRFFNQIRKAALKGPGLFAPLEAALWSHPVIVQLAAKLQRVMCRGDGALAWKSQLFEGCYDQASSRDIGDVLPRSAHGGGTPRAGGENSHVRRKLAEISGQFTVDSCGADHSVRGVELTPFDVTTGATTTDGKVQMHSFGEQNKSSSTQVCRYENKVLQLAHEAVPREVRIDTLRKKRRAKVMLEYPREGHPLEAHSDLKAQERYAHWMMRTDVPFSGHSRKAEMLPYFDSLVSPSSSTFSPPLASCKRVGRPDAPGVHATSLSKDSCESEYLPEDSAKSASSAAVGLVEPHSHERGVPFSSNDGDPHQAHTVTTGSGSGNRRQAASGGAAGSNGRVAGNGQVVPISNPQTAEEVGKLFLNMDALQTILQVDSSDIGGFANRCPAGWRSGYRAEPMSKKEIRTAHIVQKFCAGKPATAR